MNTTVTLESLKPELIFKSDLMLDERCILLPAATAVTKELIETLTEWDFKEFTCSDSAPPAEPLPQSLKTPAAQKPTLSASAQKIKEAVMSLGYKAQNSLANDKERANVESKILLVKSSYLLRILF